MSDVVQEVCWTSFFLCCCCWSRWLNEFVSLYSADHPKHCPLLHTQKLFSDDVIWICLDKLAFYEHILCLLLPLYLSSLSLLCFFCPKHDRPYETFLSCYPCHFHTHTLKHISFCQEGQCLNVISDYVHIKPAKVENKSLSFNFGEDRAFPKWPQLTLIKVSIKNFNRNLSYGLITEQIEISVWKQQV